MRLAVDATALGSGRGGDETSLRGMLRGLATVVGPSDPHALHLLVPDDAALPPEVDEHPAFTRHAIPRVGGMRRLAGGTIQRGLAAVPHDLLFCQTHAPLSPGAPTVLLVADLSFVHHGEHYPRSTRLRLRTLVPWQARRAAMVVTVSEFSRQDLLDAYGLDPGRVAVVSNPIEAPRMLSPAMATATQGRLAARGVVEPYLLYLGNLHPRKNVPRLVEAYLAARARSEAVAAHRLVVAGSRWWGGDDPQETAAAADPASGVVFLGGVDEDEREWLLQQAAGLAYPSLFEGFGLPPLEAMARGTPVLTSDRTSIPEVCGDAALLVDPTSVADLCDGIIRLVEDTDLRGRLEVAGPVRAASFSLERTGRELLDALDRAVG